MGCCGYHLCESCVGPIKQAAKLCPLCNQVFESLFDLGFERRVLSLTVHCSQREAGCLWKGVLRGFADHVHPTSGDCQFVLLQCQWNCGKQVQRCHLLEHEGSLCPSRPWYSCFTDSNIRTLAIKVDTLEAEKQTLAGEVERLKNSVTQVDRERKSLRRELDSLWVHQTTREQDMAAKIDFLTHQLKDLMARGSLISSVNVDPEVADDAVHIDPEVTGDADSAIDTPHEADNGPPEAPPTDLLSSPVSITVHEFSRRRQQNAEWYSPPFLSHANGYQFQLRVDCNGVLEGKDTHLSVYLYLTKGSHDSSLRWPFQGSVTIQLLDQCAEDHHGKVVEFYKGLDPDVSGCVKGESKRAKRGHGYSQFLSHIDLLSTSSEPTPVYLHNDCLMFKVTVDALIAKTSSQSLLSKFFKIN